MTGAIKMVDQIAVVDQFSCMSCHECVDVCDWGAIDWLAVPPKTDNPKRKKKGIDFHPQPDWLAIQTDILKKTNKKTGLLSGWQRIILATITVLSLTFVTITQVMADKRHPDPDGCLSCHALPGLDYIDQNGVVRSASIDSSHYYSSLHGSVPCKDCHRKIQDYPHKVENTEVDCAESCHVEEPSAGEAYTHKAVVEEYSNSVHGTGLTKGFTGGNRLQESNNEQNPSCRKCHSNTLYIDEQRLPAFKEYFSHTETECGTCHEGEVWLNQFGGHILRRFIGGRWDKNGQNAICNECHEDTERMAKVKIKDKQSNVEQAPGLRFMMASASYKMTLHSKLLQQGSDAGASCNECHAPDIKGKRQSKGHNILASEHIDSALHINNLSTTCAAAGCHEFAKNSLNTPFLKTDMHDLDLLPLATSFEHEDTKVSQSGWSQILMALAPVVLILGVGILYSIIITKQKKSVIFSRFGGDHFQVKMIGRKPKTTVKQQKSSTKGKNK